MKKTLIALMALAGVAVGGELTINRGGDYFAGNYIFEFTLTEAMATSGVTNDVILAFGNRFDGAQGSANDCSINAYVLGGENGAITLQVGAGTLSNLGSNNVLEDATTYNPVTFANYASANRLATFLAVEGDAVTTSAYILSAGVYTVASVGSNGSQTASLYKDGVLVAKSGRVNDNTVTLGYNGNMTNGHNTTITTITNSAYNIIPEPATATLSLLALAGLAARRRRR